MRRIKNGTAYDTDTGELIKEVGFSDTSPYEAASLYRTRNGAFFLWAQYLTPGYNTETDIFPLSDEDAQKWLEKHADNLVEQYFGEMPEGGAAEKRMTLRLPNNLATRIEEIAQAQKIPLSRYIRRCLERCAAEDGKPATIV
jgi:predicted DNA binding CopG/RHH family protein